MQIDNLYEAKIDNIYLQAPNSNTLSNYNSIYVPIDYSIIIKISLIDFNGDAVINAGSATNKQIHITCDKGRLSYLSRTNMENWLAIPSANQKSVNIPVNSSGYAHIRYEANEWGLCTIGIDTNKIQFMIKGFKDASLTKTPNNTCTFQVDESIRACRLKYDIPAMAVISSPKTLENGIIPSKYLPCSPCRQVSYRGDIGVTLDNTSSTSAGDNVNYAAGSLTIRSGTTAGPNGNGSFTTTAQTIFMEWRY